MINAKHKLTSDQALAVETQGISGALMNITEIRSWLDLHGLPTKGLTRRFAQLELTKLLASDDLSIAYLKSTKDYLGNKRYTAYLVQR